MTTAQLASFILLWLVLIAEGGLLFLLYRHVEIVYANRRGLSVGFQAPALVTQSRRGELKGLTELLITDHTLMVFGSSSCPACRALLIDPSIRPFLTTRDMSGYFLTQRTETQFDDLQDPALEVLTTEKKTFTQYAIGGTPFAYILARTGTILAHGLVEDGLESLARLCEQALRQSHDQRNSLQVPLAASAIKQGIQ